MNINGAGNNDYSRITGLASGMDTDGMVKKALAGYRAKIDKVNQDKQVVQWQQEAYVDIIKDLKEFNDSYLEFSSDNNTSLMSSKTYSAFKVDSSDNSKITGTAYAGAIKGQYTVKVDQVATGATAVSGSNGVLESKDSSGNKVAVDLKSKLSSLNNSLNLKTSIKDGDFKITVTDPKTPGKSCTFTINVDSSKTIGDFLSSMKSQKSDSGEVLGDMVDIRFSELTKKLTISTKATGTSQTLTIATGSKESNFLDVFSIGAPKDGTNAKVQITPPGEKIATTIDRESNGFIIDNIKFDISNAKDGDTVNLNVRPDSTESIDKFKKFVEKYNKLVDKISTKISEKKEYSYKPLTDDQKKEMKEDEIKKWEETAKKGILKNDHMLSGLLEELRESMYSTVEGVGVSITQVGIETGNWRQGAKLQINEEKLKTALEERGEDVQKLFTQVSNEKGQQGILQKIKKVLDKNIGYDGSLIKKAGYENSRWIIDNDLSKSIQEKKSAIEQIQKRMKDKEKYYYSMFANLERYMNQMNAQSNWLSSQLGAR